MSLRRLLTTLAAATLTFALAPVLGATAEGSRDLYPANATCTATTAGNCRANLEWRTGTYGPAGSAILRRTIFDVFLQQGDVLEMGSSAVGINQGDVVVYNPGVITDEQTPTLPALTPGTNGFSCAQQRSSSGPATAGAITSRAKELAGPQAVTGGGNPTGYVPCAYTAPTAGVYKAIFYGPAGANANTDGSPTGDINLGAASNFTASQGTSISAWDLTVRADETSVTDINGRVFTYALTAFTGGNGRPIDQRLYATTLDGYSYRVDTNGLDPNGFLIYGNESGFLDPDGNPLEHDVLGANGALSTVQGGVTFQSPQYPLSFHPLSSETLAALDIASTPTAPEISNLTFTGSVSANNSLVGAGGDFHFDQNVHGTYVIVISRNGTDFDPGNPQNRVLRGVADAGAQTVTWDGLDNNGDPFPLGLGYRVQAELHAGVYHFPLIDAENSTRGGPSFTLLNPPNGTCPFTNTACTTSFYDDRGYHTSAGGTAGTDVGTPGAVLCGSAAPDPDHSDPRVGYDSTSNQRKWGTATGGNTNTSCTGNFGDAKGLDSWTFFPSNLGTSQLNIVPVAPVATDDATKTLVNTPVTVAAGDGLLRNDTGSDITVTGNTQPAHGAVTVNPDGSYTYTPDQDFTGTDTFDYTITDAYGQTSTATVTIDVRPPPIARDDVGTTPVDTPLDGSVLDNDVGPGIQVTGHTAPAHGTVTIDPDGTYHYVPDAGYTGPDSFTYTITSSDGDTATATVSLTVTPTADDDTATTPVDTTLHGDSVLGNDHGLDLTVTGNTQPSHGTVAVAPDGTYTYVPEPGFSGTDTFTYTATDRSGQSVTATVTITVGLAANPDQATTPVNTPVTLDPLANDRGTGLTITAVTQPPASEGSVAIVDGTVVFTPAADFTGTAQYTYTISDAEGQTATATDTVTVTPTAGPDATRTPVNTPVALDSVTNDHGRGLTITSVVQPPASQGSVAIVDGRLVFTPAHDFTGTVRFDYTVTDESGQTATATDTVDVDPVVPATPDQATTTQGQPVTIDPLANDPQNSTFDDSTLQLRDPATDELGTTVIVPGQGTFTVHPSGRVIFDPDPNFTGTTDAITYQVLDSSGRLHVSTITVTVTGAAAAGANTSTTSGASGGRTADTGENLGVMIRTGVLLLLAGGLALALGRRRPQRPSRHRATG